MKTNPDERLQILIEVNGEPWIRVDNFKSSGPRDNHYVVEIDGNGSSEISFGDGEMGRRPPSGAAISTHYRDVSGAAGNVMGEQLKIRFIRRRHRWWLWRWVARAAHGSSNSTPE